jgi:hypothetical protein
MNSVQILNKIKRNLDMLGITATRNATSITVDNATISCVDASIQSPMGGVSGATSPFLGMGIVAPGQIKIKGNAGETSVSLVISSELRAKVLAVVCAFANDVVIEDGDSTTQLALIPGNVDLKMMGS